MMEFLAVIFTAVHECVYACIEANYAIHNNNISWQKHIILARIVMFERIQME